MAEENSKKKKESKSKSDDKKVENVKEVKESKDTEVKAEEIKEEAKKLEGKAEEKVQQKAKPKGNKVAIIHVFSSKNDTIITATDLSGAETLAWASGGMVVSSNREEGRPYAAMQAMIKVVNVLKDKGVNNVHVWVRAPGGNKSKTPGSGVQVAIRTLARSRMRISRIEDVTPLPTDSMRRKGGRRGRRV